MHVLFDFFSSRRRHTRLQGDWSSDVCSSDLTWRELSVEEGRGLGHDQVGLEVLSAKGRGVQVGEGYVYTGDGIHGIGYVWCVAGFVGPRLEMHNRGSADAEHDAQGFQARYPLRQFRVKAAAALLDGAEVKTGRVGDRLKEVRVFQVIVSPRDRRMLAHGQGWNRRLECVAKVRVAGAAAVPGPPGGVDGELHKVGQPADVLGASCLAARQVAKTFEGDRLRAF